MLKELLQECHMTQETVAEQAAMHRSTVARIINVPEAAHPQMIMRFAETFGVLKNHVMRWYCLEACPLGKACQSTEYREVSLAQTACFIYSSVSALNTKLAIVLSIASDERVSCDEEKDFADILKKYQRSQAGNIRYGIMGLSQSGFIKKKEKSPVR
ncbi:MAG: helix-turn-helix domain-containing protein [Phascolarctobacterium faecium]|uniref:helix-turn-helix domain-containing protein n=1 Tax=Phascolarctobacterium faecium TaxID=33025 RepID=UPI00399B5D5B